MAFSHGNWICDCDPFLARASHVWVSGHSWKNPDAMELGPRAGFCYLLCYGQRVKPLGFAGHVISVMTTLPSWCQSIHKKHGSEGLGLCSKWDLLINQTGFYCQATAALSLSWHTNSSILGEDPYVGENMFPAKWISCSPPDVGHARRESWSFALSVSRMNIMSYETSRETSDCLRQPAHVSLLLDGFYRVEGNANQCIFSSHSFLVPEWLWFDRWDKCR